MRCFFERDIAKRRIVLRDARPKVNIHQFF